MYEQHGDFHPPDDEAVLWQYMDISKFLALLQHHALHFSRADLLDDPFEGSYGALNPSQIMKAFDDPPPKLVSTLADGDFENRRKLIYVNCWHKSDHESEAMWRLYASKQAGIAVCTSVAALKESVAADPRPVHIGEVMYMNYSKQFISSPKDFLPFLRKRQGFRFDQEVRAICLQERSDNGDDQDGWRNQPPGINVKINLTTLITEVVIAPSAQDWLAEVVQEVASRYGLTTPISKSELAGEPNW
ncbi:MAG: DUF2971 domain-containing protein [Acidimicrobiaceae bacterium]|nr:DUF2971 domain-containing protein [Acidimicrobiaceae bacterium]MDE0497074.1 DUF2971 domain-containing protein [Acidimicrobiaceae bacterium]